jgi:hypothetical protein
MKRNYFTFYKGEDESNTREEEGFSNLDHNDIIGRAVSLANDISDYELYRRTLKQEFGLDDNRLNEVCDEAMRIIANKAESGELSAPGTSKKPSNNEGERPIDVSKSMDEVDKISGEFIAGPNVILGRIKEEPVKKMPTFSQAWNNVKGWMTYKDAKNLHESTQTDFKRMWKGEVNKSQLEKARTIGAHWKAEVRRLVKEANKQGIDNNSQVADYVIDKLPSEAFDTWESAHSEITNLAHDYNMNKSQVKKAGHDLRSVSTHGKYQIIENNEGFFVVVDENRKAVANGSGFTTREKAEAYIERLEQGSRKSQVTKSLSQTQKQMLADKVVEEFADSADMDWKPKATSYLRSKSIKDQEIKEILDVVADEFMDKSIEKMIHEIEED